MSRHYHLVTWRVTRPCLHFRSSAQPICNPSQIPEHAATQLVCAALLGRSGVVVSNVVAAADVRDAAEKDEEETQAETNGMKRGIEDGKRTKQRASLVDRNLDWGDGAQPELAADNDRPTLAVRHSMK